MLTYAYIDRTLHDERRVGRVITLLQITFVTTRRTPYWKGCGYTANLFPVSGSINHKSDGGGGRWGATQGVMYGARQMNCVVNDPGEKSSIVRHDNGRRMRKIVLIIILVRHLYINGFFRPVGAHQWCVYIYIYIYIHIQSRDIGRVSLIWMRSGISSQLFTCVLHTYIVVSLSIVKRTSSTVLFCSIRRLYRSLCMDLLCSESSMNK